MKIYQIVDAFSALRDKECPITERLIKGGYQQKSGGYISKARSQNIPIDFTKASPSQSWHLLDSYCPTKSHDDDFTKRIQCGELLFWMAEVTECISKNELDELADSVLVSSQNRRRGNKLIKDAVFDKIMEYVARTTQK